MIAAVQGQSPIRNTRVSTAVVPITRGNTAALVNRFLPAPAAAPTLAPLAARDPSPVVRAMANAWRACSDAYQRASNAEERSQMLAAAVVATQAACREPGARVRWPRDWPPCLQDPARLCGRLRMDLLRSLATCAEAGCKVDAAVQQLLAEPLRPDERELYASIFVVAEEMEAGFAGLLARACMRHSEQEVAARILSERDDATSLQQVAAIIAQLPPASARILWQSSLTHLLNRGTPVHLEAVAQMTGIADVSDALPENVIARLSGVQLEVLLPLTPRTSWVPVCQRLRMLPSSNAVTLLERIAGSTPTPEVIEALTEMGGAQALGVLQRMCAQVAADSHAINAARGLHVPRALMRALLLVGNADDVARATGLAVV